MAIPELADYVRKSRTQGVADYDIRNALRSVGWDLIEIDKALSHTPTQKQSEDAKPSLLSKSLVKTGHFINLMFILFVVLLCFSFIGKYIMVTPDQLLGQIIYLPTNWATAPLQFAEPYIIINQSLFGFSPLSLDILLYIPGGSLYIAALLAIIVYSLIYLILAKIINKIFRSTIK